MTMKTLAKHALLLAGLVLEIVATGLSVGQDDTPAKKQNTAGAAPAAQAAETPPKPVFTENAPVCPIETLTKVSIPNTTIHSAVLNEADGSCRVTATVTHPPSRDRVKVFIALPMKGWNGRFLGTGGGGFVGG